MAVDEEPQNGQLPEGVHHYTTPADVPKSIIKYWYRRHEIFSRYDEGIWMTDDVWFGVTPEPIAMQIAAKAAKAPASKTILIDTFGGAGGNAIQFALSKRWKQIFVVEKDPAVLQCARHNAEVYGVKNKIWFIEGDMTQALKGQLKDVVKDAVIFGSPPWGGPGYTNQNIFDLTQMQPYSLTDLYTMYSKLTDHIVLYLPRTSDLRQIAGLAPADKKLDVVHYCVHGHSNALCVWLGQYDGA